MLIVKICDLVFDVTYVFRDNEKRVVLPYCECDLNILQHEIAAKFEKEERPTMDGINAIILAESCKFIREHIVASVDLNEKDLMAVIFDAAFNIKFEQAQNNQIDGEIDANTIIFKIAVKKMPVADISRYLKNAANYVETAAYARCAEL